MWNTEAGRECSRTRLRVRSWSSRGCSSATPVHGKVKRHVRAKQGKRISVLHGSRKTRLAQQCKQLCHEVYNQYQYQDSCRTAIRDGVFCYPTIPFSEGLCILASYCLKGQWFYTDRPLLHSLLEKKEHARTLKNVSRPAVYILLCSEQTTCPSAERTSFHNMNLHLTRLESGSSSKAWLCWFCICFINDKSNHCVMMPWYIVQCADGESQTRNNHGKMVMFFRVDAKSDDNILELTTITDATSILTLTNVGYHSCNGHVSRSISRKPHFGTYLFVSDQQRF